MFVIDEHKLYVWCYLYAGPRKSVMRCSSHSAPNNGKHAAEAVNTLYAPPNVFMRVG